MIRIECDYRMPSGGGESRMDDPAFTDSPVFTDEMWRRVEPLFPDEIRRGRPWRDHRQVLEAIAWRFRTRASWREVAKLDVPWQTIWQRHKVCRREGIYRRIYRVFADDDAAMARLEWLHQADPTVE